MTSTDLKTAQIRALNDAFRQGAIQHIGTVIATGDLAQAEERLQMRVLDAVRQFDAFEDGDDLYREHDFGTFELDGAKFIWKIDYYDPEMSGHARDPADPSTCKRMLSIMFAHDY